MYSYFPHLGFGSCSSLLLETKISIRRTTSFGCASSHTLSSIFLIGESSISSLISSLSSQPPMSTCCSVHRNLDVKSLIHYLCRLNQFNHSRLRFTKNPICILSLYENHFTNPFHSGLSYAFHQNLENMHCTKCAIYTHIIHFPQ